MSRQVAIPAAVALIGLAALVLLLGAAVGSAAAVLCFAGGYGAGALRTHLADRRHKRSR